MREKIGSGTNMNMLALRALVIASLSSTTLCVVTSEDCDNIFPLLPSLFRLQGGSSLTTCTFNGRQCCNQAVVNLFANGIRSALSGGDFDFSSSLSSAQSAIDQLRSETGAILADISEDIIRPLLLSAVSSNSVTSDFTDAVNTAMVDVIGALNGSDVNLTRTLSDYFMAVSTFYFNEAVNSISVGGITISLSSNQISCGVQASFNQIYTNADAAAQLVDLLQNVSRAFGVIKQLPALFDGLLRSVAGFTFSETCLDVFISNFLCPKCHAQPNMCPERCAEIVTGCVSPLNQAILQLDSSIRLILSIVESLAGSVDRVTDFVNINRIPMLYDMLVASLQGLDFVDVDYATQLLIQCGVNIPTLPPITFPPTLPTLPGGFGKRELSDYYPVEYKRNLDIPNVSLNQTLFNELERYFTSAGVNEILSATQQFCSPDFSVEVSNIPIRVTSPNGMCSYGVGSVGTYNSTYDGRDIAEQVFNNPSGNFDYMQLVDQAMDQSYVLTDLFRNTDIPESVFSVFLPNDTMPTTSFLTAPAPTDSNPTSNPGGNQGGGGGGDMSVVMSCSLMIAITSSILALLL